MGLGDGGLTSQPLRSRCRSLRWLLRERPCSSALWGEGQQAHVHLSRPFSHGFPVDAPPTLHPPDLRASRGSFVADRLTWLSV